MIPVKVLALITLAYFVLLFAVAFFADVRREQGRSLIRNPNIYALSLAVYLTSWTFYGSVGRAATHGLDFLPVYLGPTLIIFTWGFLLRKMVRIAKENNIVSIADFLSSRYGKSANLGGIVTLFAVIGIMPYIALQLKATSFTFDLLTTGGGLEGSVNDTILSLLPPYVDTGFILAVVLGIFGILFGARHLDASERHEGLVAAVALESLVKLLAFLAVGVFVTYFMFDGVTDIFARFSTEMPEKEYLLLLGTEQVPYITWLTLMFMSMMAFMFLPRQFHIMAIENPDETYIRKAMWRFPAYMFLINLFVVPIALGGLLLNNGDASLADYFVISMPLQAGHQWLATLVFIGGFSASAGMVMVSSIALSTMILNHLIMPIILHWDLGHVSRLLVNIKRLGILVVIFLGYFYYNFLGEKPALVSIGLVSFMAVTQFAPAVIGGLYWHRANKRGAMVGISLGFVLWFYTLIVPSIARTGLLDYAILERGLFGISQLRPTALFGLNNFDIWTHSLFWTLFFNVGAFLFLSLFTERDEVEIEQADKFVNVFGPKLEEKERKRISKAPTVLEFTDLMAKFIGEKQAHAAISEYLGDREIDEKGSVSDEEVPNLKRFTEKTLAGSVGAAPARIIIENYLSARGSEMEDVFNIFGSVTKGRTATREQLAVLYDAARVVASGAGLQKILDNILKLLNQQFKLDLSIIRIIDTRTNTLTVRSQKGMSATHVGKSHRDLKEDTYIGECFLSNASRVVNDTDFMEKPVSAQIIHREGIKSFAHTPITIEKNPVGVLSAFSRTSKGIFTKEFIELFESLAGQVGIALRNNQQVSRLIEARAQERELQIARSIQKSLLPKESPVIRGISLDGSCVTASDVGGDYYDFLPQAEDAVDLVIADVSGHNVGAALLMAEARTFIQANFTRIKSPGEMMNALNEFFYNDLTVAELFITMFYLKYDSDSHLLTYASAGHNTPFIYRAADGRIDRLDAEGLIFGVKRNVVFEEKQCELEHNDILLLYTDGITEAETEEGDFFGEDRLCRLLSEHHEETPAELKETIIAAVRDFIESESIKDDISLIVMKVID
ncbi:MAG: SpoIIE family protein phosphatase [Desulfuromonadales bacterium]